MTLETELAEVLNKYSQENLSNTPDYILANFVKNSLIAFDKAVGERDSFYGEDHSNRSSQNRLTHQLSSHLHYDENAYAKIGIIDCRLTDTDDFLIVRRLNCCIISDLVG